MSLITDRIAFCPCGKWHGMATMYYLHRCRKGGK